MVHSASRSSIYDVRWVVYLFPVAGTRAFTTTDGSVADSISPAPCGLMPLPRHHAPTAANKRRAFLTFTSAVYGICTIPPTGPVAVRHSLSHAGCCYVTHIPLLLTFRHTQPLMAAWLRYHLRFNFRDDAPYVRLLASVSSTIPRHAVPSLHTTYIPTRLLCGIAAT